MKGITILKENLSQKSSKSQAIRKSKIIILLNTLIKVLSYRSLRLLVIFDLREYFQWGCGLFPLEECVNQVPRKTAHE